MDIATYERILPVSKNIIKNMIKKRQGASVKPQLQSYNQQEVIDGEFESLI